MKRTNENAIKFKLKSVWYATEDEVLQRLKQHASAYRIYVDMKEEWKRYFMDFCMGKRSLPLLYEPFFVKTFHPDIHPDRLSRLLSCVMKEKVKVCRILPSENVLIEGGSMMIMDVIVQLEDGSLANVEIQKIPYRFPGERMSCYSSDLVLRQYSRVKGEMGKKFSYADLKKVYTIVIYEKTTAEFHKLSGSYVHHGTTAFDTGLPVNLLQEYYLVALDVFKEICYHEEKSELVGWLSLLTTESLEDAEQVIGEYPWLLEIYQEIATYREKPEEVLTMFRQALAELDRNTMQYMIDEQEQVLKEQKKELAEQGQVLKEQKQVLEEQEQALAEKDKALEGKDKTIEEKDKEIARLTQLLAELQK